MKAVMYEDIKKISLMDVADPETGDDRILIRIKYSYICATDIKTYKQGHPSIKPPTILGHEFSGIVEETGKNVTGFSKGDAVTGIPFVNCGECEDCIKGRTEACRNRIFPSNGALAEYISMPASYAAKGLAKVPEASLKEAGLSEPLACVLNSCSHFNPVTGDSALVVGSGFMGVLNALALRSLYGVESTITDTNISRLELPKELGIRILDGELKKESFDTVILTPPVPQLISTYLPAVKPFGNLILFGGYPKGVTAEFDPNILHYNGVNITGTTGFSPLFFRQAVKAITEGLIDLKPFTKELYSFDDFTKAFEEASTGKALKAGIEM